jgi:hypothetical protein
MKLYHILSIGLIVGLSLTANAQCRTFVKNNCGSAMEGYVISESFNAAKLMPGDEAEMSTTFYGGEDYRLFLCHHPVLKGVDFQIIDSESKVLYDSTENEGISSFDFRMGGTDNLTIKIKVQAGYEGNISPQGCVAIMIGKKVAG